MLKDIRLRAFLKEEKRKYKVKKNIKTYVFDIDGTLCTLTDGKYEKAEPLQKRINKLNQLYDEGHTVILHTARGMGRNNNDAIKSMLDFYDFTKLQLSEWDIKYHYLFLGKPAGDYYIDDKGINDGDFFGN